MAKIASDSGLGRESLYKALKPESKPRFETILKILNSLGVKIQFNAIHESGRKNEKSKKTLNPVKAMKTRKKTALHGGSRRTKNINEKVN